MKNSLTMLIIAIMAFVKVSAQDTLKTETARQEYQLKNGKIALFEVRTATQAVSHKKLLVGDITFPAAVDVATALSMMNKGSGEIFLNHAPVWPTNPFVLFWQTPKVRFDHYWVVNDEWGQKIGEEKPFLYYYNWFYIVVALIAGPLVIRYLVVLCHDKWPKLLSFVFIVACSFLYTYLIMPDQYSNGNYGLYLSKSEVFSHYWMLGFLYVITIYIGVLFWKLGGRVYNKMVRKQNEEFVSHML